MPVLRYKDGDVTVTLTGDLEMFVRKALDAAGGETSRVLEAAAEQVAQGARAAWYAPGTGVQRDTGRSGQIDTITTVSNTEVRVSVGSTDTETVRLVRRTKTKGARIVTAPRAAVIHRPGPFATTVEEITHDEYRKLKAAGGARAKTAFRPRVTRGKIIAGKYYRKVASPRASDGKYLVTELIRKPVRAKVREITPELGRAIAARIKRGG